MVDTAQVVDSCNHNKHSESQRIYPLSLALLLVLMVDVTEPWQHKVPYCCPGEREIERNECFIRPPNKYIDISLASITIELVPYTLAGGRSDNREVFLLHYQIPVNWKTLYYGSWHYP
jgi:hypothetical protein